MCYKETNHAKPTNSNNDPKGKYTWKKLPRKPGKPNKMVWKPNGTTYYWCPKHRQWTIHTPEECTKGMETDNATANLTEDTVILTGNKKQGPPKAPEFPTMTIDSAC
jgi:hypothetical protein